MAVARTINRLDARAAHGVDCCRMRAPVRPKLLPSLIPPARLRAYWMFVVLVALIGLLSIKGTELRRWAFGVMPRDALGIAIAAALTLSILAASAVAYRRFGWRRTLEILPLLVGVYIINEQLSVAEERLHFVTFGFLGAAAMNAFGVVWGMVAAGAGSFGDEGLQYLLPDRVGDWRDVRFNLIASGLGLWAAARLRRD